MSRQVVLHLCADTGSDSKPYADDNQYEVVLVGSDIGVENFSVSTWLHINGMDKKIVGIFANPVCTEFSTARSTGRARNPEQGMTMVKECRSLCSQKFAKAFKEINP